MKEYSRAGVALLFATSCALYATAALAAEAHASAIPTLHVEAKRPWNSSGVRVQRGEKLIIHAQGHWTDLKIETDAVGFERPMMTPFKWLARIPSAHWFALIACVDHDKKHCKAVYPSGEFTAGADGELTFFANDAPGFYGNNSGALQVTVTRPSTAARP